MQCSTCSGHCGDSQQEHQHQKTYVHGEASATQITTGQYSLTRSPRETGSAPRGFQVPP